MNIAVTGKSHAIMLMIILLSIVLRVLPRQDDTTFFDSPFPTSTYKKVLDTTMIAWEDIQLLNSGDSRLDRESCEDLIVGRLVRLQDYCLQLMQEHKTKPFLPDDIDFLATTIEKAQDEYHGTNKHINGLLKQVVDCLHAFK